MKSDLFIIAKNNRRWRIEHGFLRPAPLNNFPTSLAAAATIRMSGVGGDVFVAAPGTLNSRPKTRLQSSQVSGVRTDGADTAAVPRSAFIDDADQSPLFELRSKTMLVDMLFARDLVILIVSIFALIGWALFIAK